MNYRLKTGKKLPGGIRRIARKQIDRAIKLLGRHVPASDDGSTHLARKWLKKTRATVRLIRPVAGAEACRRESRRFREIARRLARPRDAEVLAATLEKLRDQPNDPATTAVFAKLESIFEQRQAAAMERLREEKRRCRTELRKARRRIGDWPLSRLDGQKLSRAVRQTYRQGLKAFAEAARTGEPEHFHEWRKRAKDLWYQARLLQPARPDALGDLARDLKLLSEHLGDEHDLAMLEAALKTTGLDRHELDLVLGMTHSRRLELQRVALSQGRILYAEKPAEFGERIKKYLKHWRR